eukprot:scpid90143/ scgid18282/ 
MSGFSKRHWVVVASKYDSTCFDHLTSTTDSGRVTRTSYDGLETEIKRRWRDGQLVGALGSTVNAWGATFVKGGLRRGKTQSVVRRSSYEGLRKAWKEKDGVITQLAGKGDDILALFSPMLSGEKATLFTVSERRLKASDLQDVSDRAKKHVMAAAYFEKEDRWIFVLTDVGYCAERWTVRDTFDPQYIRDGYREGYMIRQIVASPTQWFIIMQRNDITRASPQSFFHTMSSDAVSDFVSKKWKEHYNITAFTGNAHSQSSSSSASSALVRPGSQALSTRSSSGSVLRLQRMQVMAGDSGLAICLSSISLHSASNYGEDD